MVLGDGIFRRFIGFFRLCLSKANYAHVVCFLSAIAALSLAILLRKLHLSSKNSFPNCFYSSSRHDVGGSNGLKNFSPEKSGL